jgi:putative pyoverdin transport system ATP-binding/permease protein
MLTLLRFIGRMPHRGMVPVVCLSVASGVANTAILHLITRVINEPRLEQALVYALLSLVSILALFSSRLMASRMESRLYHEMRLQFCSRLLEVPLRTIERVGPPRIFASLANDLAMVANAAHAAPDILVSTVVVVGASIYLLITAPTLVLLTLPVVLVAVVGARIALTRRADLDRQRRKHADDVERRFYDVIHGAKELRLSAAKKDGARQEVTEVARALRSVADRYGGYEGVLDTIARMTSFVVIGVAVYYGGAVLGFDKRALAAVVLIALYLIGPVQDVLTRLAQISKANVAFQALESIGLELTDKEPVTPIATTATEAVPRIELDEVEYTHGGDDDHRAFKLGPVDLDLQPGSITMVVGGNGSGKSTLVKVLCGLYPIDGGAIRLNGVEVTTANVTWYREHFSVVFFDFHLFDRVWNVPPERRANVERLLEAVQLSHRVKWMGDRFSTLELSAGQRRRLALVTALLEERPIYVFDEWAADQDPKFKHYFYRTLLPDLRAAGKTVVVVSHDDRYFDVANQRIKLEDGKQVNDETGRFIVRLMGR